MKSLVDKIILATDTYSVYSIAVCGGVSANERLTQVLTERIQGKVPLYVPLKKVYCTDNAAMIGVVGLMKVIE